VSFLLTCATKDLRRRLADPLALVLWLGIPLLVGGLMIVMFGGQNAAPPKAHVLLVDEDGSVAGRLLGGLAGSGADGFLEVETVTREVGLERMDAGDASAMLVLPAGFSEAVLDQTPTAIELVKNPAQSILPGIVQTGAEILVELIHYLQRLLGEPMRQLVTETPEAGGFLPSGTIALVSGAINDRLAGIRAWLFPPALTVEFVDPRTGAEQPAAAPVNFGALFLPCQGRSWGWRLPGSRKGPYVDGDPDPLMVLSQEDEDAGNEDPLSHSRDYSMRHHAHRLFAG
jgi:hypothetical protein